VRFANLSSAEGWKCRVRWSEFEGFVVPDYGALTDTDLTRIAIWLCEVNGIRAATDTLHRAVRTAKKLRIPHPRT
jgi:hypothetical protein